VIEEGWYCEFGGPTDDDSATVCYEKFMDGLDFGTFECDVATGTDNGCILGAI